jgi:hypothetical protein
MFGLRGAIYLIAIAAVFLAGRHMGRLEVTAIWGKEKAVLAAQALEREGRYVAQLSQAAAQDRANRDELDRLRSAPHPRLLCHSTPAVQVPPTSDTAPAGGGALPQAAEFDPSAAIYATVADPADTLVENCRSAMALWPRE